MGRAVLIIFFGKTRCLSLWEGQMLISSEKSRCSFHLGRPDAYILWEGKMLISSGKARYL
jgi:hypothetical protein